MMQTSNKLKEKSVEEREESKRRSSLERGELVMMQTWTLMMIEWTI